MHSKFLRHGTGSCAAAINYVLNEHENEPDVSTSVLYGDPHNVAEVADALNFKYKYTSQVLSFSADDKVTDEQVAEVVDAYIKHANAGLEPEQFACTAVMHRKNSGSVDVHIIQARVELTTGKSMNVAPPGHIEYFDPLRDMFNEKYQWQSPDIENHPDKERTTNIYDELASDRKELKKQLNSYITDCVENGLIQNRDDVVTALNEIGANVTKQSVNFITIKTEDMAKGMRLKGAYYNENFTIDRTLEAAAGAAAGRSPRLDGRTFEQLTSDVERCAEQRAAYNRARYQTHNAELDESREIGNEQVNGHDEGREQAIDTTASNDEAKVVASDDISRPDFIDDLRRELWIRDLSTRNDTAAGKGSGEARKANQEIESGRGGHSNSDLRGQNMRENRHDSAGISGRLSYYSSAVIEKINEIIDTIKERINERIGNEAIESIERTSRATQRANDSFAGAIEQAKSNVAYTRQTIAGSVKSLQQTVSDSDKGVEQMIVNNNHELERFKSEINLVEYLVNEGYEVERDVSTAASVAMKNKLGEKLVVATASDGHSIYFNVGDDSDSGTIIDYVKNHKNMNLGHVRKELRPVLNMSDPEQHEQQQERRKISFKRPEPSSKDLHKVGLEYAATKPIKRLNSYLTSERKLSPDTIRRFSNSIRENARGSAVFPHVNLVNGASGITGFETKGKDYTSFSKGGEKGLWIGGGEIKTAKDIVIVEAAIDAMSHAQLNPAREAVYVSVAGSMSEKQEKLVQRILSYAAERDIRVSVATDKDAAGEKLAERLNKLSSKPLQREVPEHGKDWNDQLKHQVQQQQRQEQLRPQLRPRSAGQDLSM